MRLVVVEMVAHFLLRALSCLLERLLVGLQTQEAIGTMGQCEMVLALCFEAKFATGCEQERCRKSCLPESSFHSSQKSLEYCRE